MMSGQGSQGQGMNQSQGVFGLPRNDTFPQFGQRATTPSQGNTRFGFGPQESFLGGNQGGIVPPSYAPHHMASTGMRNPYSFDMQTPQNTQGLNQGQINAGVYVNPQGNVSFSGGPPSPMSSLTAGFLGRGQPQPSFHQNGSGPPAPSYPMGQTEGFGPSPPMNGFDPSNMATHGAISSPGPTFGAGGAMTNFGPWAMSGQPKPMVMAPPTGGAQPFPASAPQFDMFGRPTVANRNPFAR